jgi:hypothetical protein
MKKVAEFMTSLALSILVIAESLTSLLDVSVLLILFVSMTVYDGLCKVGLSHEMEVAMKLAVMMTSI